MRCGALLIGAALCWITADEVGAQSVLLRLPADGTWVRYEGTYTQTEIRPESTLGKLEIPPWAEHVTIKSVGSATAEYRGENVPCRWIEIKVERGRESEGKIAVGKTGLEIYKVLVPEGVVTANPQVEEGVPIGFVPIVKGARVIGTGAAEPLSEPALRLYPLALLFSYCRDMQVAEQAVDPGIAIGAVSADVVTGSLTSERPTSRTQMDVKIWTSVTVPFGVAAWTAKIVRSIKDSQQPRDDFKPLTEVEVSLKAQATGDNAQSEVDFE